MNNYSELKCMRKCPTFSDHVGVNIINKFLEKNDESPQEKPGPVYGLASMRALMNAGDYTGFVAECRRIDSKMSVRDMTLL